MWDPWSRGSPWNDEPSGRVVGPRRQGSARGLGQDDADEDDRPAEQLDRRMEQLHTQVHGEHDAADARDRDAAETELAGDELLGRLLKLAQRAD